MKLRFLNTKLAKSTYVYTASTFLNYGIPFILLPILTRYLSVEEYGILSMFNATSAILLPFVGMSVNSGIQRKMADGNDAESREYTYNALIVIAVASALVLGVLLIANTVICSYTSLTQGLLILAYVFSVSNGITNIVLTIYQMKDNTRKYAVYQNACTVLNVGLSLLLVIVFNLSLNGRVIAIAITQLIFAIIGIIILKRYIDGKRTINKDYIWDEISNFSLPLLPTQLKSTVLTYTDRVFITNMVGVSTTGIYSLGNQFALPILFLEQSFNLAFVPWLYKKLGEGDRAQRKKIVKLTYAYFVIVAVFSASWAFISLPFIGFIAGERYVGAYDYMIWLSMGYAFTGMQMMVVNYIYYAKKLKLYTIVTIAVIIINIVLNYILISKYGSIGAAQATCICNAISFILTWILAANVCSMPWFKWWK